MLAGGDKLRIILLSGGSGKRLWPLSNDIYSKQFIKIFHNQNGSYESMLQRVYRQLLSADPGVSITIATSKAQVSVIRNQLGDEVDICVEPDRKDTFPAIVLASIYLNEIKGVSKDEIITVCPIDPYVGDEYFDALKDAVNFVKKGTVNLTLLGIEPSYPSEKYGYILPLEKGHVSKVDSFKEKPSINVAKDYINRGALWNSGVFVFQLQYMIKKAHELIDFKDYSDLLSKYARLDKISFDYAIAEREKNIQVIRFNGQWKDMGTWNTLTEAMPERVIGNAILSNKCDNVHVINELDIPVLCMGLKNMVISAGPDGILVSDKDESSYMKPYVDSINQQIRFAEKSWGSYRVLDVENESLTIKIILKSGMKMSYHSHKRRKEVWVVISGKASVILDGNQMDVSVGDIIEIQKNCKHTIIAKSELEIIEVQIGKEISIADKKKYVSIH